MSVAQISVDARKTVQAMKYVRKGCCPATGVNMNYVLAMLQCCKILCILTYWEIVTETCRKPGFNSI